MFGGNRCYSLAKLYDSVNTFVGGTIIRREPVDNKFLLLLVSNY